MLVVKITKVSVYSQNFWTNKIIDTLIELYQIKIGERLFLGYKVMTIFITHGYTFITFRRFLVPNEYMETQLILFEGNHC